MRVAAACQNYYPEQITTLFTGTRPKIQQNSKKHQKQTTNLELTKRNNEKTTINNKNRSSKQEQQTRTTKSSKKTGNMDNFRKWKQDTLNMWIGRDIRNNKHNNKQVELICAKLSSLC